MMRKNSKRGAVEVFVTADLCNSLIVALESFIVADSRNKYAVYAQKIKDKILKHGRCFMNGDEENVAIYFYENEAALLIKMFAIYVNAIEITD
ncbi:MAG: hypothetical protein K2I80_12660 [Ruminococcus sp.]|nr:hypothetical protein [Ruminococcus sp.]MDE6848423.1 hypothetical protein [Ruminococcus sp.]